MVFQYFKRPELTAFCNRYKDYGHLHRPWGTRPACCQTYLKMRSWLKDQEAALKVLFLRTFPQKITMTKINYWCIFGNQYTVFGINKYQGFFFWFWLLFPFIFKSPSRIYIFRSTVLQTTLNELSCFSLLATVADANISNRPHLCSNCGTIRLKHLKWWIMVIAQAECKVQFMVVGKCAKMIKTGSNY